MDRMPGSCHCRGQRLRHQRRPSCQIHPSFRRPSFHRRAFLRRPSCLSCRHEDRWNPYHHVVHRWTSCRRRRAYLHRRHRAYLHRRHVGHWSPYQVHPCPCRRRRSSRHRQIHRRRRTSHDPEMQNHSSRMQTLHRAPQACSRRGTRHPSFGNNAFHPRPGSDRSTGFHPQGHASRPCCRLQASKIDDRCACCCHRRQ